MDTNDKEYMFSTIIKEGLTYGQAMDALMHEGKKVTRAVWKGYWCVPNVLAENSDTGGLTDVQPTILAVLRNNGGLTIASPYNEDLFAKDWMIVE